MKQLQRGYTLTELLVLGWIVLLVIGAGGWAYNIVKLIGMNFDPMTGMLVARIAGIFVPPLGAVMGFL